MTAASTPAHAGRRLLGPRVATSLMSGAGVPAQAGLRDVAGVAVAGPAAGVRGRSRSRGM